MSEVELAVEGNYQSDYRGESLKSIYNKMWIFLKKVSARMSRGGNKVSASQMVQGKQFNMGENELQLGGENKNHFTAAVG